MQINFYCLIILSIFCSFNVTYGYETSKLNDLKTSQIELFSDTTNTSHLLKNFTKPNIFDLSVKATEGMEFLEALSTI